MLKKEMLLENLLVVTLDFYLVVLNTPEEIARQFFIANRALFNAQQSMHLDLKAANEFEVEDEELAQVFDERGIPANVYWSFL